MHFLDHKISTIFPFCNAEMAKLALITFKYLKISYDSLFKEALKY